MDHPISQMDNIDISHYSNEFLEFSTEREIYIKENFVIENEFELDNKLNNKTKFIFLFIKKYKLY